MRILQLSPRFPFPLYDGGAVGIIKISESLAKLGHHVTFVSYPDPNPRITEEAREAYKNIVQMELTSKPLPSMKSVLLRTILKGAYPIERRMMSEMFALIERLMKESHYDIVHIDHAHMGKYGLWMKERYNIPIVLREHNYEALIYKRFAANEKNPFKKLVAYVHGKRLRREEARFFKAFDAIVPITSEDEVLMRRDVPSATYYTIPAGVDTHYYQPSASEEISNSILWIGGINWLPNLDAIEFFAKEIFPLIVKAVPEATFDIVGEKTDRLQHLVNLGVNNIRLHGRIPDIRPFMARTAVMICALRVGGGMRLKLLDFFASGKAVVSTHIGAEGNAARDGEEILLRDGKESFADAVVMLLKDPQLRKKLGAKARDLAEREYSWDSIGRRFCEVYEKVIQHRNEST